MIRLEWGEQTATALLLRDRDVQFKNYPGVDHEIAIEEVMGIMFLYVFLSVSRIIDKRIRLRSIHLKFHNFLLLHCVSRTICL